MPTAENEQVDSGTTFAAFDALTEIRFRFPNASAAAEQTAGRGGPYLTNLQAFVDQVIARNAGAFRVHGVRRLKCLPPRAWSGYAFRGRRVLFLLSSHALGDCVGVVLFLQALLEQRAPAEVAVACSGPAHDIFGLNERIRTWPIWIGERDIAGYDAVVDLGQLEAAQDIDIWPVDVEGDLLRAFGLAPAARYPAAARALPAGPLRVGVLPLASSPLRTLPVAATRALLMALAPHGEVTLCLNRNQRQGALYREALGSILPGSSRIVDSFASIADLLTAVGEFDYAVFADSGPAHIAKLFATPGVAVYTSAPGDVLQGRFRNLARWSVAFAGPHCRAPCGLAKLRERADGAVGCMGSLGVGLAELPRTPRGRQPAVVDRLLHDPVPCVASLAASPEPLAQFVRDDLEQRRAAAAPQGR